MTTKGICDLNISCHGKLVIGLVITVWRIHSLEKEHQQTQRHLKCLCGGMLWVCGGL